MAKVTISALKKMLKESAYKPREKYKFVLDLDNPDYCILKAMELLTTARSSNLKQRQILLRQAISLIVTARVQYDPPKTLQK